MIFFTQTNLFFYLYNEFIIMFNLFLSFTRILIFLKTKNLSFPVDNFLEAV